MLFGVITTGGCHQNKFLKNKFSKILETAMVHNVKCRPCPPQAVKSKCGGFHTS